MSTEPWADPAACAAYAADGAVVLRGLLTPQQVDVLRQGIDANLAAPSARAIVASRPDDPGFFIEDFCNWADNPHYREVIFHSRLAEAAARLMGSRTARLYHDHMLTKEPGTRQPTPWHQDQPYYNVDGMQNVSFWIPVDPVSRAATLEFAAGTHRGPWLMPRTFMTNEARWFPEGTLAELPDIEAGRRADPPAHHILGWALEPGRRRRVFSVRFLGDDMRHAPRRWKTSPEFHGLADELPAGAVMNHPRFPLLWEQAA